MTKPKEFIDQFNTLQTLSGLDFGDKTIGIAICDKTKTIATPIMTLRRKSIKKDIEKLFSIFKEYNVSGVVIGLPLSLNGNENKSTEKVRKFARELEKYDLFWLEDPINHQDFEGLSRIADVLDTPIAAGEYHYGIEPFRTQLERRSIDIVMVDLLRAGGITQWMKAAHLAEAYNLPVVTHLATEVLMHCLAACPNGLYVEHMPWTFAMFNEEPKIVAGEIVLPQSPGLGLSFNEDNLQKYAVS